MPRYRALTRTIKNMLFEKFHAYITKHLSRDLENKRKKSFQMENYKIFSRVLNLINLIFFFASFALHSLDETGMENAGREEGSIAKVFCNLIL